MSDALRKAAQDVIDRWHSPKWAHDSVHTGVLIDRLRAALAAPEPEPVVYWDGDRSVIPADDLSYIPNWSDYYPTPLYRHPAPQSAQPVSLETVYETIIEWDVAGKRSRRELARRMIDLFAAPPAAKEWVGLTDEEVFYILKHVGISAPWSQVAKAIEAALRAKNTGEQA